MKKRRKKREKGFKKTIVRREKEKERGRQECTSERKRVCACVYVGVRNFEEEKKITRTLEEPSSAYFTHSTRL